jgi:hypothetical protein
MPLVRPLADRAEPEPGAKPIIHFQLTGEAEPRLTSGGGAASNGAQNTRSVEWRAEHPKRRMARRTPEASNGAENTRSVEWRGEHSKRRTVRRYSKRNFSPVGELPAGFGEVAGAVAELEFLFAQGGVGDFDCYFPVGAVVLLVRR